ncbi:Serine/threonine-protein kinase [Metarhizium acridum]|uniref:Serine/threonine-protein kinase n=1 Tax=Metarhizium acridum TaxID=92637 RepID=UPI001C6D005E|nr:Serine/threonine-protein kinase [Metarhizium acridum]
MHEDCGLSQPEQHQNIYSSQHHTTCRSTGNAVSTTSSTESTSSRTSAPFATNSHRPQSSLGRGFRGIPTIHGRVSSKYMPYGLVDFDKVQVFINSIEGTPDNPTWAGSNTQYKFDVSRVSELTAHLFIRNPAAARGFGRSQDIFLGCVREKSGLGHVMW